MFGVCVCLDAVTATGSCARVVASYSLVRLLRGAFWHVEIINALLEA